MQDSDWYEIKFLESTSNLKGLIKKSIGRTPSTKIANQIAVCIQQGRLFFEAASLAPLQIKPLQIYYGVLAFSKSVILARNLVSIDTLIASHGLVDISAHNASIEQLALRIGRRGAFQQFNDAIAPLGRIWYFDNSMPKWTSKPFSNADGLCGREITITEIFSRIPDFSRTFERTFGSSANAFPIQLNFHPITADFCDLRIDDPELFTDRESLIQLIRKWRKNYSFLDQWCFAEATLAWGYSVIIFRNLDKGEDNDLSPDSLVQGNNGFSTTHTLMGAHSKRLAPFEMLPPLSGGITRVRTH